MTIENNSSELTPPPTLKKRRIFGHVMLAATVGIIVLAVLYDEMNVIMFALISGFLSLGGYLPLSKGEQINNEAHDFNLGTAGFGPKSYLKNIFGRDTNSNFKLGD